MSRGRALLLLYAGDDRVVARGPRLWDRLRARLCTARLDRDLAAGLSPDDDAALALHARTLTRPAHRRALARTMEEIFEDALRRPGRCCSRVPFRWDRIREAAPEWHEVIGRLCAEGPVPVRGVAAVRVLLSDGGGPLYADGRNDLPERLLLVLGQLA